MDLSKSYEKIKLYEILLKTSFSAFLPNFGNISAKCRIRQSVVSAKCLFGKVVFGEVSRTRFFFFENIMLFVFQNHFVCPVCGN